MVTDERSEHTLAEAAEAVIRRLRGVQAVRVEPDNAGGIRLIHVLGGPDRSPKVIAVDVVSAVAAELGVELEPRQVRVAPQQRSEAEVSAAPARLKYVGMTVSVIRGAAEVKVHLEDHGLVYEGIATGPDTSRHRFELVAEATLHAVEVFLRAEGLFVLEDLTTSPLGSSEVTTVTLTLTGREEETLAGKSLVRDDRREAVVRAVLDAINRPVSWLTAQ